MTRKENIRNWRIQKVARYLVGIALSIVGIILFVQSFLSGSPTEDAWKFGVGFIIAIIGITVFSLAWNESFKDYLRKRTR